MIKKILFILGLMIPATANAALTNSLGFAAGGTYGVGLSYSRDTTVWGIQITGLPIWDQDSGGRIFGGINLKRHFHENGKVGLYGSVGVAGGLWKDAYEECEWESEVDEAGELTEKENCREETDEGWGLATGPGVGMQMIFWENLLFRFELPLAVRFSSDGFGIIPIPNVALMYRW